ncbi:conserved hypothetical protein [Vibrio crassostreae]|nr:conserved hypothetical protein [Vibrio chagasii]CAK2869124.1 conserved hypothetical protein [Vibrio crassostreae]
MTTAPVFTPTSQAQLDKMVEGLKQGLSQHLQVADADDSALREVVLNTLLISGGASEWEDALNQKVALPDAAKVQSFDSLLPQTIWAATDSNLNFLALYFNKPADNTSSGTAEDADIVIYNPQDAVHVDDDYGVPPAQSDHWAYVVNKYQVEECTVAMPCIEEYGVIEAATDSGCVNFLQKSLWLQHINEELCATPVDRGDNGSDSIWIKLESISK